MDNIATLLFISTVNISSSKNKSSSADKKAWASQRSHLRSLQLCYNLVASRFTKYKVKREVILLLN